MKKLILTTAAVLTSLNLFAQGTVAFTTLPPAPTILNIDAGRDVNAGDNVVAHLLWAAPGSGNWAILAGSQSPVGTSLAGRVLNAASLVTGVVAGTDVDLYIQAWDASFNDYDAALAGLGLVGESPSWTQPTGGAGDPPGLPISIGGYMPAFGVAVVPEPSAIALGLLGAGALLLLRRRK